MSKTTKNTKTSNTKSGKQKQSILKRFSLKTKKSKYIAVVAVVAIVGSVFTFRSFASTPSQTWTYTRAGNNMKATAGGACKQSDYNDPAKNKMLVASLTWPGDKRGGYANAFSVGSYLPAGYTGHYRACATVKGSGFFTVSLSAGTKFRIAVYPATLLPTKARINSQSYVEYCTNYVPVSAPTVIESTFDISNTSGETTWLNVAQVKLDKR